jgi:fatty acid desaturase
MRRETQVPEDLEKRPDWVSAASIFAHAALVFGPLFVVVAQPPGVAWLLCYLWFGVTAHGVLNLLHECAHYHVFSARTGSDVVGRWMLGPLVFTDFDAFRRRHWDHHRFLGREGDTKDAYLWKISGWGLASLLYRCLTLQVALRKWRLQSPAAADRYSLATMARTALAQAIFLGVLVASCKWISGEPWTTAIVRSALFYVLVFVYGLASLSPFVSSLRTIAEHQPGTDGSPTEGRAVLRNFHCGPFGRLVFGAYGFADHATHHLHPAVPAYRLPALTRRDDSEGLRRRRGYLGTLAMLVRGATGDSEAASLA